MDVGGQLCAVVEAGSIPVELDTIWRVSAGPGWAPDRITVVE
jgi:hypothetical protein